MKVTINSLLGKITFFADSFETTNEKVITTFYLPTESTNDKNNLIIELMNSGLNFETNIQKDGKKYFAVFVETFLISSVYFD